MGIWHGIYEEENTFCNIIMLLSVKVYRIGSYPSSHTLCITWRLSVFLYLPVSEERQKKTGILMCFKRLDMIFLYVFKHIWQTRVVSNTIRFSRSMVVKSVFHLWMSGFFFCKKNGNGLVDEQAFTLLTVDLQNKFWN